MLSQETSASATPMSSIPESSAGAGRSPSCNQELIAAITATQSYESPLDQNNGYRAYQHLPEGKADYVHLFARMQVLCTYDADGPANSTEQRERIAKPCRKQVPRLQDQNQTGQGQRNREPLPASNALTWCSASLFMALC